jgi:regulator of cell morphogenesis and NO signaling
MNELSTKSLAEIVTSNNKAAGVFEKYHLDFCCNGKHTLQQVCAEKEIKFNDIVSELESSSGNGSCQVQINYDQLSLSQLADYIVMTHHNYVKKTAPAIALYVQKVAINHGDRHPEMREVFELFRVIKGEMEQHMKKEEIVLFPRIKIVENQVMEGNKTLTDVAYLHLLIAMIEEEHDQAGSIMREIRQLTNGYILPADACTTYRLSFASLQAFEFDLHQHVHLENNIFFPKALELFKKLNETP